MTNEKIFIGDFETTVYDNQQKTEVWASALVELYTEDCKGFHSIDETFDYLLSLNCDVKVYYHNLKFDGSFWLPFLLQRLKFNQAFSQIDEYGFKYEMLKDKEMKSKTFKYMISAKGQWYSITIKGRYGHFIRIYDSLKLLPFSVREISKAFKTKHKKLDMEYKGYRYSGCNITKEEWEYIFNDVLVVKEALEILFTDGYKKMTIGSCCMSEFKVNFHKYNPAYEFKEFFPNIAAIEIDSDAFSSTNADEYIRHAYRGGWCYLVKGAENRIYEKGVTADVNSLYPSVMHSESGNFYPVGHPHFWRGDIPDIALQPNKYFFIRVKTRFYLKPLMLPTIQIKDNLLYKSTEWLETSDVYDPVSRKYYTHYTNEKGETMDTRVTLTLTMTDYQLMREHYELVDFEVIDGCWFFTKKGVFDGYINKYKKIKMESEGAKRTEAKLFLNNLYGKLSTSQDSSFKYAFVKPDKSIGFLPVAEYNKQTIYIPAGAAITAYARKFTIDAAQRNFYGADKKGFKYADTDSIHCDLDPSEVKGIKVDDNAFCCWKLETSWDKAIFVRQKTYIEHVTHENLQDVKEPYYNIKCAGLPDKSKNLLNLSMCGTAKQDGYIDINTGVHKEWTSNEKAFLFDKEGNNIIRTMNDFKKGLKVPDKLLPKRIEGGLILTDTFYEMR